MQSHSIEQQMCTTKTYPGTLEYHGSPPLRVADPGQGGFVGLEDVNAPPLVVKGLQFNAGRLEKRLLRISQAEGGLDDFFRGYQEDEPGNKHMEQVKKGGIMMMMLMLDILMYLNDCEF